jgi:hypothetical protein
MSIAVPAGTPYRYASDAGLMDPADGVLERLTLDAFLETALKAST